MELDNIWCLTEYGNDWAASITSQLECQDMCFQNPSCMAISYSYSVGMNNICYMCKNSESNNRNSYGFAFYRKPGKVMLLPNSIYALICKLYILYLIIIMSCS